VGDTVAPRTGIVTASSVVALGVSVARRHFNGDIDVPGARAVPRLGRIVAAQAAGSASRVGTAKTSKAYVLRQSNACTPWRDVALALGDIAQLSAA